MGKITRRTLLRGAGTVAVGLPFLEEMAAAAPAPPVRVVTAFFGLGLDRKFQLEQFGGPLEPYRAFERKMSFFTNVHMAQAAGGVVHCEGGVVIFNGERKASRSRSGGPTIDQLAKNALHRDGVPPTHLNTLVSGLWYRSTGCDAQPNRVWNADGTPRQPVKRPSKVFEQLFGSAIPSPTPGPGPSPVEQRELRIRRSVLDTVMEQYRGLRGDGSYLGNASKQKLEQHFQSIRSIEKELAPADAIAAADAPASCAPREKPTDPPIADYESLRYGDGRGAPVIPWQDFEKVFRMHADLWALGLRCDLVRFGNIMFESAGGHVQFRGVYEGLGQQLDFTKTLTNGSPHDSYVHTGQMDKVRIYQHLAQRNLAYFLSRLDDPTHLESNGKTVLDNTLVVLGTEVGWNHSLSYLFHAIAGGNGHFKPGWYDQRVNAIDVYNTVLRPYGIDANIGRKTGVSSEGNLSALLA